MYLIDTCVFSELIKNEPMTSVIEWILKNNEESYFVSVLTFGEIKKSIEKLSNSSRAVLALIGWRGNRVKSQKRFQID